MNNLRRNPRFRRISSAISAFLIFSLTVWAAGDDKPITLTVPADVRVFVANAGNKSKPLNATLSEQDHETKEVRIGQQDLSANSDGAKIYACGESTIVAAPSDLPAEQIPCQDGKRAEPLGWVPPGGRAAISRSPGGHLQLNVANNATSNTQAVAPAPNTFVSPSAPTPSLSPSPGATGSIPNLAQAQKEYDDAFNNAQNAVTGTAEQSAKAFIELQNAWDNLEFVYLTNGYTVQDEGAIARFLYPLANAEIFGPSTIIGGQSAADSAGEDIATGIALSTGEFSHPLFPPSLEQGHANSTSNQNNSASTQAQNSSGPQVQIHWGIFRNSNGSDSWLIVHDGLSLAPNGPTTPLFNISYPITVNGKTITVTLSDGKTQEIGNPPSNDEVSKVADELNSNVSKITGRYDHWRILARGPIPDSVLNDYAPAVTTEVCAPTKLSVLPSGLFGISQFTCITLSDGTKIQISINPALSLDSPSSFGCSGTTLPPGAYSCIFSGTKGAPFQATVTPGLTFAGSNKSVTSFTADRFHPSLTLYSGYWIAPWRPISASSTSLSAAAGSAVPARGGVVCTDTEADRLTTSWGFHCATPGQRGSSHPEMATFIVRTQMNDVYPNVPQPQNSLGTGPGQPGSSSSSRTHVDRLRLHWLNLEHDQWEFLTATNATGQSLPVTGNCVGQDCFFGVQIPSDIKIDPSKIVGLVSNPGGSPTPITGVNLAIWGVSAGVGSAGARSIGFRITDNESPRPSDRVFINYNYDIPLTAPNNAVKTTWTTETFGFEHTFLDGNANFAIRFNLTEPDTVTNPGQIQLVNPVIAGITPVPGVATGSGITYALGPIVLPSANEPNTAKPPDVTFKISGIMFADPSRKSEDLEFKLARTNNGFDTGVTISNTGTTEPRASSTATNNEPARKPNSGGGSGVSGSSTNQPVSATSSPATGVTCTAFVANQPTLRQEGMTEGVGDIVINCTGGTLPRSGANSETGSITVTLTPRTQFTLQDLQAVQLRVDNSPGAPAHRDTGTGAQAPNVIQGVVNDDTVTFFGVPLLAPYQGENRVFRITNLRANAAGIGDAAAGASWEPFSVQITTSPKILVNPDTVTISSSHTLSTNTGFSPGAFGSGPSGYNPTSGVVNFTGTGVYSPNSPILSAPIAQKIQFHAADGSIIEVTFTIPTVPSQTVPSPNPTNGPGASLRIPRLDSDLRAYSTGGSLQLAAFHPSGALESLPAGTLVRMVSRPRPDSQPAAEAEPEGAGVPEFNVIANGNASGEAFEFQVFDPTGKLKEIRVPDGLILEPIQEGAAKPVAAKSGERKSSHKLSAYCVNYDKDAPKPNGLYRVAAPEIQEQYKPVRAVIRAGRELAAAGKFHPDSDPEAYAISIRQYALWTRLENWNEEKFAEVFREKTRAIAEQAKVKWTKQHDDAVRALVPGRWRDITMVLEEARKLEAAGAAPRTPAR